MNKICPKCKCEKDVNLFNSQKKYCKECHNILNSIWRENNREKYRECQRKSNRKYNYKRQSLFKKTDKGKILNRASAKRYRARKLGCTNHHTEKEWITLLNQSDNKCSFCNSKENLTKDHIIPLSKGGSDLIDNIQVLCNRCNASKGNRIKLLI